MHRLVLRHYQADAASCLREPVVEVALGGKPLDGEVAEMAGAHDAILHRERAYLQGREQVLELGRWSCHSVPPHDGAFSEPATRILWAALTPVNCILLRGGVGIPIGSEAYNRAVNEEKKVEIWVVIGLRDGEVEDASLELVAEGRA